MGGGGGSGRWVEVVALVGGVYVLGTNGSYLLGIYDAIVYVLRTKGVIYMKFEFYNKKNKIQVALVK